MRFSVNRVASAATLGNILKLDDRRHSWLGVKASVLAGW